MKSCRGPLSWGVAARLENAALGQETPSRHRGQAGINKHSDCAGVFILIPEVTTNSEAG